MPRGGSATSAWNWRISNPSTPMTAVRLIATSSAELTTRKYGIGHLDHSRRHLDDGSLVERIRMNRMGPSSWAVILPPSVMMPRDCQGPPLDVGSGDWETRARRRGLGRSRRIVRWLGNRVHREDRHDPSHRLPPAHIVMSGIDNHYSGGHFWPTVAVRSLDTVRESLASQMVLPQIVTGGW